MRDSNKRLDQLDEIGWKFLRTAHGTAEHIPGALRELVGAHDQNALTKAYWMLDNYVILQGTLYESAYFVIPYVIGILLTAQSAALKVAAYDLLVEIARGVPDPNERWAPPPDALSDLRDACRHVIESSLAKFEPDLRSHDGSIRSRAMDLFSSFGNPEHNAMLRNTRRGNRID